MCVPAGHLRLCEEEGEHTDTEQKNEKAEVSVSEMEDRQTTFGCLSNGTAAKNEERSVQEIKKALGLLFNQLLKLLSAALFTANSEKLRSRSTAFVNGAGKSRIIFAVLGGILFFFFLASLHRQKNLISVNSETVITQQSECRRMSDGSETQISLSRVQREWPQSPDINMVVHLLKISLLTLWNGKTTVWGRLRANNRRGPLTFK